MKNLFYIVVTIPTIVLFIFIFNSCQDSKIGKSTNADYIEATNSHELESFPGIINRKLSPEEHEKAYAQMMEEKKMMAEMEIMRSQHISEFDPGTPKPEESNGVRTYHQKMVEEILTNAELLQEEGRKFLASYTREDKMDGANLLFLSMQMRLAMIQLTRE